VGQKVLEVLVGDLDGPDVGLGADGGGAGRARERRDFTEDAAGRNVAQVDFASISRAYEGVNGAGKNEEKGVAGFVLAIEDLAGGKLEIGRFGGEFLLEFGSERGKQGAFPDGLKARLAGGCLARRAIPRIGSFKGLDSGLLEAVPGVPADGGL
jgi:hypothetical protein